VIQPSSVAQVQRALQRRLGAREGSLALSRSSRTTGREDGDRVDGVLGPRGRPDEAAQAMIGANIPRSTWPAGKWWSRRLAARGVPLAEPAEEAAVEIG